ncbi:aminoglycoside phosphotransferase family protein [Actinocorallia sp. B10E7]|uniref:aminoglycoside phosphotransferase family protein n=1 Tax=Actinocorallia sp. B10E7 TaxID=3153558 RepID=UPI00325D061B
MRIPEIPESLVKAIVFLRGEENGHAWLRELPERIGFYCRQWNLHPESIAEGGAMSCCIFCTTSSGTPAVLKIPVDEAAGLNELRLLQHWSTSEATPQILDQASDSGVFLMTRILPGTTAWATADHTDSQQFGALLDRLNHPLLPQAPPLKDMAEIAEMRLDWARDRFADPRYANDVANIKDAERVLDALLQTTTTRHVLHADLQAKNILRGPDRWYAIDPLGASGDLNAEAALWIAIQDGPTTTEARLIGLSAHQALHPDRLRAWTFVLSVAEYRPYLPPSAKRIEKFLANADTDQLINLLL